MEIKKNNKFIVNELKNNLGNYIVPDDTKNGIAVDIGCNNGCFLEKYKDQDLNFKLGFHQEILFTKKNFIWK
jgi:hypothetical protein